MKTEEIIQRDKEREGREKKNYKPEECLCAFPYRHPKCRIHASKSLRINPKR